MGRGLQLPIGVGPGGGSVVIDGDEQAAKIIWTALSDCDNDNAFQQDIGLGVDMVFDVQSPESRGKILRRLYAIFRDFERNNLYSLVRSSVKWRDNPAMQETELEFNFVNLESDELSTFRRVIR
jgi:hypothetical protein